MRGLKKKPAARLGEAYRGFFLSSSFYGGGPPLRLALRSIDRNHLLRGLFFLRDLRDADSQDAVFVGGLAVRLLHAFTHIERTGAGAGRAFLTDQVTFLLLFFLVALGGGNRKIAVLQFSGDFFLLEAREVDRELLALVGLADISLHQAVSVLAKNRSGRIREFETREHIKRIKNVQRGFIKNSRNICHNYHSIMAVV